MLSEHRRSWRKVRNFRISTCGVRAELKHSHTPLSDEQLSHEGIIPSGLFSFSSHTTCARTVMEQIESDFSQQSEIVPSMVFSDSGRVFLKRDIQHPMQTVFYRPVLAYRRYLPLIFAGQAGKEKPLFCCYSSIWFAHPNRLYC
jgi:hypothetical protein